MADARGRVLGAVLPGAPQLLVGRWGSGGAALLSWTGCLAVLVARTDRVLATPSGGPGEWTALAALLSGLALPWVWSWRDLRRGPARATSGGPLAPAFRSFARNPLAVAGLMALGVIVLAVLMAPLLAPGDPSAQGPLVDGRLAPPSWAHPLGTDGLARDVLSRVLYGGRISLSIAVLAVAIAVSVGTLLGAVAGYVGGFADSAIMRLVDTVLAFPRLVLLITVVAFFEPSLTLVVLVLGFTQWPGTARLVRGEVLSVREREYVEAARALGYGGPRILFRHVLPNALAPVIVAATLGVGNTIVLEAGLSFLSLGPPPPTPTWGGMVEAGRGVLLDAWWLSFFPGVAIVITVLAVNLVGDGLRDALDPRMRREP